MFRTGLYSLCIVMLLFTLRVQAADQGAAGQVIIASGTVYALAADGSQRSLQRRSTFYPGETIHTAADAEVQLRFTDGALMSLRGDSELKIDQYRFQNQGGEGDRSMSTLIKGGLRTITGVIGKQDASAYRVSTPVATIGVRGTHYEAVLESPESLAVAAWQGGIQVRNARGELDLGVGGDFNFGRVEAQQPPQGLLEPPAVLDVNTPVGRRRAMQQTAAKTDAAAGENTQSDSQTGAHEEGSESAPPPVPEATTDTTETVAMEGDTTLQDSGSEPLASGITDTQTTTLVDTSCGTCAPPQQIIVNDSTSLPLSSDLRFTSAEWSSLQTTPYLGIIIEANDTPDYGFDGGRVLNHGANSPVFTDNGYGPHEPQYATAPILDVIRRGAASVDAFGSYTVDAQHTVYWGTWNGNVNPVEIQTDATDPTIKDLINTPFHWATMLPTDPAVMAARTGTITLNNVVVAHGGGSGGGPLSPANVTFNATVDFDTGLIPTGMLGIYNGPEIWNVNFKGQVRGNIFDTFIDTTTSTVTAGPNPTQAVEGDMGFAFTGNNGQAVGGGFNFQAVGNPATHVEGILLVQ